MPDLFWLSFIPPLVPVWYCLGYTATLVRLLPLVFFLLVDLFKVLIDCVFPDPISLPKLASYSHRQWFLAVVNSFAH